MEWTKESTPQAIKEAKSEMKKFIATNYQEFAANNDNYPSLFIIYKIYDSWNDMIIEVFGEGSLNEKEESYAERYDVEVVNNVTKKCIDEGIKKYKDICKVAKEEGVKYPSLYFLQKEFGSFTSYRSKFTGEDEYQTKPEFCRVCGIGRCRFDYSLDNCEYYEGE